MKVREADSSLEKTILTGMITKTKIVARITSKWRKGGLFSNRWANIVGGWCVSFYQKTGKAPVRAVKALYEEWAEKERDQETVKLVELFLSGLSESYKTCKPILQNTDYLLDKAGPFFNAIALKSMTDHVQRDLELFELERAQARLDSFSKIEMGVGAGIDVLADKDAVETAVLAKPESIIRYPGALGNFFGDSLERDGFIAFMGPEKRGKTFWLIDLAWRGMLQKRRVAFFEVGDMSQNQIMRRFLVRAMRRPFKAGTIKIPTALYPSKNSEVEFQSYSFMDEVDTDKAMRACRKVTDKVGEPGMLRLSVHPNSSIDVSGVKSILESWGREGWVPDVVVIDYADILAPPAHTPERELINTTWKQLRALSQYFHCLVATATQTKTTSYSAETLDKEHFADDKRKYAHVTGTIGINVTPHEKRIGVTRLNWVVLREGEFVVEKCVYSAGCLAVCNPAIISVF